jgi:hypothetical protein
MSAVLSRSTKAGSIGLVIDGGSTSTYGTLPTTGDAVAWAHAAEVTLTPEAVAVTVEDLSGPGSGGESARFVTGQRASGTVRIPVTYASVGPWLQWALGAAGTTGSPSGGYYTHTYAMGMGSFALSLVFVYQAADGTSLQDEFWGAQVESAELAIDAQGVGYLTLTLSANVASRSSTYQLMVAATQTPAANSLVTDIPVLGKHGAVLSFGGNSVAARTLSLSLTRPLDRAGDFGTDGLGEGVLSGPIVARMTITRAADEADSATLRSNMMAGTRGATSITFTSGSYVFKPYLSQASIASISAPFTAGGALVETVEFSAQSLTSSDYGCKIELTNQASSAAPSQGTWA